MHEAFLIYTIFLQPKILNRIDNVITAEMFADPKAGRVFGIQRQLWFDGAPPDRALVEAKLSDRHEVKDYLYILENESAQYDARVEKANYYVEAVKTAYLKRQTLITLNNSITDISNGEPPENSCSSLQVKIDELFLNTKKDYENSADKLAAENEILIEEKSRGIHKGYEISVPLINACLPYIEPKQMTLITAYVRTGKTTLAINLVEKPLNLGANVLYFTLEGTRYQLANRFISLYADMPYRLLESGEAFKKPEELERYSIGKDKFSSLGNRLKIYDHIFSLDQIINETRLQQKQNKVDFVVIDYIGLCDFGKDKEYEAITRMSKRIAQEKKRLNVSFIVLQQIPNSFMKEKTEGMIPGKSSGQLAQDCDIAIHLDRENYELRETYIKLLKNKQLGQCISGKISYNRTWTKFVSVFEITQELQQTAGAKENDRWF